MGYRRLETREKRQELGDGIKETGVGRWDKRDRSLEMGYRRREIRDKRQELGDGI